MDIASEIIKKQVTSSQKNHDAATVCDMLTYELDGDRLIVKRVAPPTDVELSALQDTLSE